MIRAELRDDPLRRRVALFLLDDSAPAGQLLAGAVVFPAPDEPRLVYDAVPESIAVRPTIELTYAELDALVALLAPRAATALDAAETVAIERARVDKLLDVVTDTLGVTVRTLTAP